MNESQNEILKTLEKVPFKTLSINLVIIVISFVVMMTVMAITNIWYLPIVFLTALWGMVAGINLVGWTIKAEEYINKNNIENK